ncbi:hypothetical protein [Nostoc sp.]|uniref:hypothetical protein n=1 Tax=Nostoc sp. TaxID=1180 RepID=UPI002FF86F58
MAVCNFEPFRDTSLSLVLSARRIATSLGNAMHAAALMIVSSIASIKFIGNHLLLNIGVGVARRRHRCFQVQA